MRLLVANDDGLDSPALHALVKALVPLHEVLVTVPSRQCSGTGHGFTFTRPLHVAETTLYGTPTLIVDGLPSDAVKYAVCTRPRPDLILAGINPGENAGVCAPYSGTVACAREGSLWGIPSYALSTLGMTIAHYEAIALWVLRMLIAPPPCPAGIFWNVNFPAQNPEQWGEAKVCAGAQAMFRDVYKPVGDGLWQLEGYKPADAIATNSDDDWLRRGHPALTPHRADSTDLELVNRVAWLPSIAPAQEAA